MSTDATTIDRAGLAERERVLALLRAKEAELRALGVMRLRLFGSIARGEAGRTATSTCWRRSITAPSSP